MEGNLKIKAINTRYNGYLFRSRLEAKWAVFFDAMGINYEYEPEGFEFENGQKYLPDFYLPELKTYVEIKSKYFGCDIIWDGENLTFSREFWSKTESAGKAFNACYENYLVVFGDPYDSFSFDKDNRYKTLLRYYCFCKVYCFAVNDKENGHKYTGNHEGEVRKCIDCDDCEWHDWAHCIMFAKIENEWQCIVLDEQEDDWWNTNVCSLKNAKVTDSDYDLFRDACIRARNARFEHGEKP